MNLNRPIAPTDLRDYAKAKGWGLLKEAAKDRLYVLTNPSFDRRQLVFPMDTTAPDYTEALGHRRAHFDPRRLVKGMTWY